MINRSGLSTSLLLAPAILIVGLTTLWPLGFSFWASFHDWRLLKSPLPGPFVGLENYWLTLTDDPDFWPVVWVTVRFVVLDVAATVLAALGLALLLVKTGFAHSVLRGLLVLPFAISPALIGISWRFMFNPEYGAFQRGIGAMLPFMDKVDWFASPALTMAALISADLWHWAPYFAFMLMGALATVPPETQEAARIDGASEMGVFRHVTLPQIAPVLTIAAILKTVFALKVFDSIVTMTSGGPGRSTTTLAYYAYQIGFRDYDMGYAAAVAYILTAILFALSFLYIRRILPADR
jgi:multiple sugar transport system permease protein